MLLTAQCQQVPPPVGPYAGGFTARISKINPRTGARTTVADHVPSSQTSPDAGSFVSGVLDVAFIDDTLYAPEAGAGCSHGLKGTINSILRVDGTGRAIQVAGLSSFLGVAAHHGHIYAPEAFTGFFAPTPALARSGTVVRLNRKTNAWEPAVTGLRFPRTTTFDNERKLFISNKGLRPAQQHRRRGGPGASRAGGRRLRGRSLSRAGRVRRKILA